MIEDILVVIIDNETEITEALSEMLGLEGFKVLTYQQPEKALANLTVDSAAVVLSDVKMPKLDGLSLLARLQKLDASLPVLLMSGHGDIPMAMQAMMASAQVQSPPSEPLAPPPNT
ncbi:MAG: response regulator, partial [Pseudomonadales bacterium]|nr:response regulator [Pseudomonadales bacterium]